MNKKILKTKKTSKQVFIAALFIITQTGNNPDVLHWVRIKQTLVHSYHGILLISKKEPDIATCNKLSESQRNNAE